jgi:flagellar FliL protein
VFKKMLPWVIMIFVVITLIVFAAFLLWNYLFKDSTGQDPSINAKESVVNVEPGKMSAAEIKELSVEINDVLTNLSTGEYVKLSFTFEMNNEHAKEEFTLLDFKIRAIILQTLADLTPAKVNGSAGQDLISTTLMNKINQILNEGKVRQVNITNFVLS